MTPEAQPRSVADALVRAMRPWLSPITARGLVDTALNRTGQNRVLLDRQGVTPAVRKALERGLAIYLRDASARARCIEAIDGVSGGVTPEQAPEEVPVSSERDVVVARSRARAVAAQLGFDATEQIKVVTAVSEVSRNIFNYAGSGRVVVRPLKDGRRGLEIIAEDHGPGIPNLEEILAGEYQSRTGMGLGLRGCKRLMSEFLVETGRGMGTRVTMRKFL